MTGADHRLGLTVIHQRYVDHGHAHYGGALVDGAYGLALFGDVATEVCIRTDGDEGLFAGYRDVAFHDAVRAGDVVRATATVTRVGRRSRELELRLEVLCRARPDAGPSTAEVLDPPLLATTATGTVVVPGRGPHDGTDPDVPGTAGPPGASGRTPGDKSPTARQGP